MPAYPYYYQPYYQQPVSQPIQQQPVQTPQQTPQIQNGGFVTVASELEARNYPVAPGNSVTFKDERAPYIYTKTMGFSQLDQPVFDKYKLIKEDAQEIKEKEEEVKKENEELKEEIKRLKEELKITDEDLDELREDIKSIWSELDVLKQPKRSSSKRDKDGDD